MLAGFHETEPDLIAMAARIGLDLDAAIAAGQIRVLSVDAWAWALLTAVSEQRAQRVFVDAITDIQRIMPSPGRMATFTAALINELRSRGATALLATEIEAYADDRLAMPVPAASATMDNGILLRQVELNSSLHRLVSVLKARQMGTDPAIREFVVGDQGITVSKPFATSSGPLSGRPVTAGASGNEPT